MHVSNKGMLAILHFEAIVLNRYKDVKGIWTIGAGVTHAAHPDIDPNTFTGELTLEQAFSSFRHLLKRYEADVEKAVHLPMLQNEFDSFVSFHWNTGGIAEAQFVREFNAGADHQVVAKHMMNWVRPKSLFARRRGEKRLFLHAEYPNLDVHVYHADKAGHVLWHSGKVLHAERALELLEAAA